jgi:competence ComEA-like helix-hairpin-helix protein
MTPYTRHQLLVLLVVLLAAGLGLAVGHWRRAHPALVERLEQLERRAAPDAREGQAVPRNEVGGSPRAASADVRTRARPPSLVSRSKPAPAPLDLNHAGAGELVMLPGVGPALAARIVAAREAGGLFESVDDLRRVRGLGRATIERLRPVVRIAE